MVGRDDAVQLASERMTITVDDAGVEISRSALRPGQAAPAATAAGDDVAPGTVTRSTRPAGRHHRIALGALAPHATTSRVRRCSSGSRSSQQLLRDALDAAPAGRRSGC